MVSLGERESRVPEPGREEGAGAGSPQWSNLPGFQGSHRDPSVSTGGAPGRAQAPGGVLGN